MVVIPETIREFGSVHRRQKSDKAENTIFEQENYYYFCNVEDELVDQELDDYEQDAEFVLRVVDIDTAIEANNIYKSDVFFDEVMIKREFRVLRLLKMSERYVDYEIKLVPYYRNDEVSLVWYQDLDVCKQVDNRDEPYDLELLHSMYDYLCTHGDCYYIEYNGVLVGDVSLRDNGEIAIVICKEYQNRHIGRRCVNEIIISAKEKGMNKVRANIYSFNKQSQKMFKSIGFDSIKPFIPLINYNIKNINDYGPIKALTGPISRNDVKTVKKHIETLDRSDLYKMLSNILIEMSINNHDYSEMKKILEVSNDNC